MLHVLIKDPQCMLLWTRDDGSGNGIRLRDSYWKNNIILQRQQNCRPVCRTHCHHDKRPGHADTSLLVMFAVILFLKYTFHPCNIVMISVTLQHAAKMAKGCVFWLSWSGCQVTSISENATSPDWISKVTATYQNDNRNISSITIMTIHDFNWWEQIKMIKAPSY